VRGVRTTITAASGLIGLQDRLGVVGQSTVAKAYQLLKSIMGTAMEDELIRRNPCRIKGAGMPSTPEREMIPLTKVVEIVTTVPDRYRALVLLGTFASLRWSELAGAPSHTS
jgi:hypothetical protein